MEQVNALDAVQADELLDNVPFAVYVWASDCRKLLYANRLAKELALEDSVLERRGAADVSGDRSFVFQEYVSFGRYMGSKCGLK